MYDRIVVPLDGSDLAERALRPAAELAQRLGVPLHLLRVADVSRFAFGANEAALEYAALGREVGAEETESDRYLEEVARRIAADGPTPTTEIRRGFAAREIVAAARPDDLIVLASHGRTGPARLLLGSVAEEVTRHADAPVLLVRGDAAG